MHSGNGSHNRQMPSPHPTDRRYVGITSYGNAATHASHPTPPLQGQLTYGLHPIPSNPTHAAHIMQPPPARSQSHQNAYTHVPLPNHPSALNEVYYGNPLPPPNPVFSQNIQGVPTGQYMTAAAPQPFVHMTGAGPAQMTQYGAYQSSVPSYGMLYGNYEEIKGPPHSHAARGQSLPVPMSPSSNRASHPPYTPRTQLPVLLESFAPAPAGSSDLRAPAPRGILRAPLADGIVRVPCRWGTCTILLDDLTVAGIKRHLRDHHPEDGVEVSKGQSGVCQWSHGGVCHRKLDVASFGKHIASVHLKSTAVPCPYCHTIIGRQDSLERHKRDHCPKRPM